MDWNKWCYSSLWGHHYAIWASDSNFLLAQKISGQPNLWPHFRHCVMHFLKHCPLVSVADKTIHIFIPISVYYLNCLLSWIRHGENQNTILKFIVPWCLLQLSNRIHVVHSLTIRCTLLIYITSCLSSGRGAKHSPLAVTCYHLNS